MATKATKIITLSKNQLDFIKETSLDFQDFCRKKLNEYMEDYKKCH